MSSYVKLNAQGASATIYPERGGLLSSLQLLKQTGEPLELLWLPQDFSTTGSGWPGGGMPFCFPFAGRVFLDGEAFKYKLGGATYGMPIHGFAYGMSWQVADRGADSCTLTCSQSEATKLIYPYEFEVKVTYTLSATRLKVDMAVTHKKPLKDAPEAMPVALGWHPYWRSRAAAAEATRVVVWARQEIQVTPAGAAGKGHPSPAQPWQAALSEPKSQNLILGDLTKPDARFEDGAGSAITLSMTPASAWQNWVLWRKDGEGFQCVEPWMGLPDAVNNGAGLKKLVAGETLSLSMVVALSATKP